MELAGCIGNAELFPVLRRWNFFNHAGVSPLAGPAADAMRTYAAQAEADVYLGTDWYDDVEKLRLTTARLINAHRDEIAFVKNTSEGISIVANGLDWQWGDVIVTSGVEYPANIYPWMEAVRNHGCELVMIPEETDVNGRRAVPAEKILHAIEQPQCRLVSLSHVEYASGQRHELARIGKKCREHKVRFCVDAIQSLGVLPIDVEAMHIDYLSADGHKWLMGPEGARIVSFTSPAHHHSKIAKTLRAEHKTEIAVREGRLRVSAHFYNTERQIDDLLAAMPVN